MISRRAFLSATAVAMAGLGLAACGSTEGRGSGTNGSSDADVSDGSAAVDDSTSVIGGIATDQTRTSAPDPGAKARTAEEAGDVLSDDGLRQTVRMDLPSTSGVDFNHVVPDAADSEGTVLKAKVDANRSQQLFLWEEGRVPAATKGGSGGYDPNGFRPTVTSVPATTRKIRGAVLLCAGGAFAIGGYSAGGILCGEAILNQGGSHSPAEIDSGYQPDELDAVDASVAAVAMIYSFYGRLAVAETDADVLRRGKLPPTYYCYGTRDPFYDQFEDQVDLVDELGYTVRARVLDEWPHGFGAEGGWVPEFDKFMRDAFARM